MKQEDESARYDRSEGPSAPAGDDAEDPQRDEQPTDNGQRRTAVGPDEDQLARQAANDEYNPDNDGNNPTHGRKSSGGNRWCQRDSAFILRRSRRMLTIPTIVLIAPPT